MAKSLSLQTSQWNEHQNRSRAAAENCIMWNM